MAAETQVPEAVEPEEWWTERSFARLCAASFSLGELESLVSDHEHPDREQLARVADELRIALLGTDEERAQMEGTRRARVSALLVEQGTEGGGGRD